jgi:hypothetical protein
MNLQQVKAQKDLYPQLRTRSGQKITTHEMECTAEKNGTLSVVVKTVFPPSARRRSNLVVSPVAGGIEVRPVEPDALSDAQRFAELVRERWQTVLPTRSVGPVRLVKDEKGCAIHLTEAPAASTTDAAPPAAESPATLEGDS